MTAMRQARKLLQEADSGQVLVGVLVVMLLMAIMVPAMVLLTQREAKWTEKQAHSTTAFHLAESGIEKGYRKISLSTATWYNLTDNGTAIDDFKFDKTYSDVAGGDYAVSITSGPAGREATIISIGRVQKGGRTYIRGIKAVFAQFTDEIAISADAGVSVGGKVIVHWGAVISQQAIVTDGRTSPQFKSAGSIDLDTDGAGGVNCGPQVGTDICCQWFSYSDVPEDLGLNTGAYITDAAAETCTVAGGTPAGSCYYRGDQSWTTFSEGSTADPTTVYVEGNLTVSQRLNIVGELLITGDFNVPNGTWGDGDVDMTVPQLAWKQYCNNWADYRATFDGAAAALFPGLDAGYKSSISLNYQPTQSKTAIQGLLYIGGNLNASGGGGGNTRIYGTLYVLGAVSMDSGSSVTVYYNKSASEDIKTLKLNLKRVEWQAVVRDWPI